MKDLSHPLIWPNESTASTGPYTKSVGPNVTMEALDPMETFNHNGLALGTHIRLVVVDS